MNNVIAFAEAEQIVENLHKAMVQLNAAHKKIKKYDSDNEANAEAVIWLKLKVSEMALEYINKGDC